MAESEIFDLLIIGAGISGLGVAQLASQRGFKTCLIESEELSSKTSANSLRIIHGGIRYLQDLNIPRVLRSARAQGALLRSYPEHIQALECYMPLERAGLKSRLPVALSLLVFNFLKTLSKVSLPDARVVSRIEDSFLRASSPYGLLCWYDAQLSDPLHFARLIAAEIKECGGRIYERCALRNLQRGSKGFVAATSDHRSLLARAVINTAGPQLDKFSWRAELTAGKARNFEWCRAYNFVVRSTLFRDHALGLKSPQGRLLFLTPRKNPESGTAIGTWYLPLKGQDSTSDISEAELEQGLAEINDVLPGAGLTRADVLRIESGVLPVKYFRGETPVLFGDEQVFAFDNYIEVLSTKYTTFQAQAELALSKLNLRPSASANPLETAGDPGNEVSNY